MHRNSEVDFIVNIAVVRQNLLRLTNSPDSVLGMDSMASERFRRSPSLELLSDSGDKDSDEGLGNATVEDYLSPDLDENEIIRSGMNKEAKDEIDQVTFKFRSFLMKTLNGESGDLDYTASCVDKDLNLKKTVIDVHCSYISSNICSHRQFTRGGKSLILDLTISRLESGKTDAPKEIATSENDLERSKLPLPPRLREASHRNPLRLRSPRKFSFRLQTLSSFKELFSPKESSRRNSVESAVSETMKKQKEIRLSYGGEIKSCANMEKGPRFYRTSLVINAGVVLLMKSEVAGGNGCKLYNLKCGQSGQSSCNLTEHFALQWSITRLFESFFGDFFWSKSGSNLLES